MTKIDLNTAVVKSEKATSLPGVDKFAELKGTATLRRIANEAQDLALQRGRVLPEPSRDILGLAA